MLRRERKPVQDVAQDALLPRVGRPDAVEQDRHEAALEIGVLDVLRAAEERDAEGDQLVALRGRHKVG